MTRTWNASVLVRRFCPSPRSVPLTNSNQEVKDKPRKDPDHSKQRTRERNPATKDYGIVVSSVLELTFTGAQVEEFEELLRKALRSGHSSALQFAAKPSKRKTTPNNPEFGRVIQTGGGLEKDGVAGRRTNWSMTSDWTLGQTNEIKWIDKWNSWRGRKKATQCVRVWAPRLIFLWENPAFVAQEQGNISWVQSCLWSSDRACLLAMTVDARGEESERGVHGIEWVHIVSGF